MSFGIRVWNASGFRILDTNSRTGRVLGYVSVSDNGSLSVPDFSQGTPYYITTATSTFTSAGGFQIASGPNVSISGSTISWTYPASTKSSCIIVYGVY